MGEVWGLRHLSFPKSLNSVQPGDGRRRRTSGWGGLLGGTASAPLRSQHWVKAILGGLRAGWERRTGGFGKTRLLFSTASLAASLSVERRRGRASPNGHLLPWRWCLGVVDPQGRSGPHSPVCVAAWGLPGSPWHSTSLSRPTAWPCFARACATPWCPQSPIQAIQPHSCHHPSAPRGKIKRKGGR